MQRTSSADAGRASGPADSRSPQPPAGESPLAAARVPRWRIAWTALGRLGLAAFLALVAVQASSMVILMAVASWTDYESYWNGARSVAAGAQPYAWLAENLAAGSRRLPLPALLAVLLAPLALVLDYATLRGLWLVLNLACLAAAVWLVWRTSRLSWRQHGRLAGLAALALLPSTIWALGCGQPSPILLLVVAGAYAALAAGRPAVAGGVVALGASLKVFPLLIGGYLLLRGQWRGVGALVGVGLALLALTLAVVGWPAHWAYFADVVPLFDRWYGGPFNVSIPGVVTRLLVEKPFTTPWRSVAPIGQAWSRSRPSPCWRRRPTPCGAHQDGGRRAPVGFGLVVVASLLSAPINGQYNLMLAAVPLAIAAAADGPASRARGWLVAAIVLLGLPVEFFDLWPIRVAFYPDLVAVPAATWPWRAGWGNLLTAGPFLGLLLLWGLLARGCLTAAAARPPPAAAQPPPS